MGDYYSLRFTAALTPQGATRVRELLHRGSWNTIHDFFAQMPRAVFIPFGALQYAPDGWVQAREVQDVSGVAVWHVCCSIKVGADDTVLYFFRHVLPPMLLLPAKVEWYNELTHKAELWLVTPDAQVCEVLESPQPPTS